MAKKHKIDDCPPAARRFPNDQLEGMGSTALHPNEMRTNHCERVGMTSIPKPDGESQPIFVTEAGKGKKG